LSYPAQHSVYD